MCLQLPFNLAAICFLGGVQFYAHWSTLPQYASHLPDYNATIAPCLRSAASGSCAQDGDTAVAVLQAVAQGISEVWIVSNVWSGVIILVGVALCSPRAALFAVLGSLIGLLTALVLAVDGYDAWLGLWGYNSVLSAIAVGGGVFAKPTWRASLMALLCALASSCLYGTLRTFLGVAGCPAFTLPFCVATFFFLATRDEPPIANQAAHRVPLLQFTVEAPSDTTAEPLLPGR